MKSKASIKGHPIHPILIAFPIAFFMGSFVFDALGFFKHSRLLLIAGYYMNMAGIIGAFAAAVPGVVDYFFTVPPDSSAKKRGATHGILNVVNLLIFIIAFVLKRRHDSSFPLILCLEAAGLILLVIAGWLGGTLVYRNQIGVDPRYAEAGKWKEVYLKDSAGRVEVGRTDELKLNQMKLVHVKNKRIVIGKTEDGYVAFDDHCTHKGGSLAGGALICGTVQCPWHGSHFDVHTGAAKAGPAKESIHTYPLVESNGHLYLSL